MARRSKAKSRQCDQTKATEQPGSRRWGAASPQLKVSTRCCVAFRATGRSSSDPVGPSRPVAVANRLAASRRVQAGAGLEKLNGIGSADLDVGPHLDVPRTSCWAEAALPLGGGAMAVVNGIRAEPAW